MMWSMGPRTRWDGASCDLPLCLPPRSLLRWARAPVSSHLPDPPRTRTRTACRPFFPMIRMRDVASHSPCSSLSDGNTDGASSVSSRRRGHAGIPCHVSSCGVGHASHETTDALLEVAHAPKGISKGEVTPERFLEENDLLEVFLLKGRKFACACRTRCWATSGPTLADGRNTKATANPTDSRATVARGRQGGNMRDHRGGW